MALSPYVIDVAAGEQAVAVLLAIIVLEETGRSAAARGRSAHRPRGSTQNSHIVLDELVALGAGTEGGAQVRHDTSAPLWGVNGLSESSKVVAQLGGPRSRSA